ncbi:FIG00732463: hypothetical protein [Klebsiella aerogenes EA1509E]|nr:FIG00732463: hypothetical protein [Klebsiella aerogenes EA1509E]
MAGPFFYLNFNYFDVNQLQYRPDFGGAVNGTIFSQSALQRRAAWLALFAILLIVVAPLISVSLQKDPMSAMPGMHHAMPMGESHDGMSGHEMVMMHGADSASQPAHSMPVDHAEACGYCVLLAHVPGLLFALALYDCGSCLAYRDAPVNEISPSTPDVYGYNSNAGMVP